nr:NUDIX domain-containing protein [Halobacterium bonnevillei]
MAVFSWAHAKTSPPKWFVPGGTVLKNEPRTEAVHCVANEELGESVVVVDCLGIYEHFYDSSEVKDVDSKHDVSTAYHCRLKRDPSDFDGDGQHSEFGVFRPPFNDLHPYVKRYLNEL